VDARTISKLVHLLHCAFFVALRFPKILPFAAVAAVAHAINEMIVNLNSNDDCHKVINLLLSLGGHCHTMYVLREEANISVRTCDELLTHRGASSELFLCSCELGIDAFPVDFISGVSQNVDRASFAIVSFAIKVNAQIIVNGHEHLIERTIAFVSDAHWSIDFTLFSIFLHNIFNIHYAVITFGAGLTNAFNEFLCANTSLVLDRMPGPAGSPWPTFR
jgi:hypothetical protein